MQNQTREFDCALESSLNSPVWLQTGTDMESLWQGR